MNAGTALIALCARAESHPVFAERLRQMLASFTEWETLPKLAEENGMAPLLYMHLKAVDAPWPKSVEVDLKGLCLRHQHASQIYDRVLREVLTVLKHAGIHALVLKGSALGRLVYARPELRPRRDLDILVDPAVAERAYQLLREAGFSIAPTPFEGMNRYSNHFTEATRQVGSLSVSLELHVNLFIRFKLYKLESAEYAELLPTAMPFDLDGFVASTLGREEMLWHLYHHGFSGPQDLVARRPTVGSTGRLLGAADVVSLVEKWVDDIDWSRVRRQYPQVFYALPMFHFLTPWSDRVLERLKFPVARIPEGIGEVYVGYPKQLAREHWRRGVWRSLRETFLPSEWWVRTYYGLRPSTPLWVGRLRHAVLVLWDLAIYSTSVFGRFRIHPH